MTEVKKVTMLLENQQVTEIAKIKALLLRRVPKGFTISQTEIVKQAIDHYYDFLKEAGEEKNDQDGISFGKEV